LDRIIYQSTTIECKPIEAFEFFTLDNHLEKWLTKVADVEPKVGGKYELFWNPEDKQNDSTIGCKILAIVDGKLLCFEWKGPKQFKHFMNTVRPLTEVTVFFLSDPEGTEIHLLHTGWRDSREWDEARRWFVKAWKMALEELHRYAGKELRAFESSPEETEDEILKQAGKREEARSRTRGPYRKALKQWNVPPQARACRRYPSLCS
jgi:uncharacterized protein YndB with AHSA1/START domain